MDDLTVADQLAWDALPEETKLLAKKIFKEELGKMSNYEIWEEGRREGIQLGRGYGWQEGFEKGVKVGKANKG